MAMVFLQKHEKKVAKIAIFSNTVRRGAICYR